MGEWVFIKAYKKRLDMRPQFDPVFRKNAGVLEVRKWSRYGQQRHYVYDGNEKIAEYNPVNADLSIFSKSREQEIKQALGLVRRKLATEGQMIERLRNDTEAKEKARSSDKISVANVSLDVRVDELYINGAKYTSDKEVAKIYGGFMLNTLRS